MATICPYCAIEISESAIEAEDGCCPECGAILAVRSAYDDGSDSEYEDDDGDMLDFDDDDEFGDFDEDGFYDDDFENDFEEEFGSDDDEDNY